VKNSDETNAFTNPVEKLQTEVCVIGAGFAGMCAAIASARSGAKTVLLNDRSVPGGNGSSEIRVGINGAAYNGKSPSVYARETGIMEEIKLAINATILENGQQQYPLQDAALFDILSREPNLTFLFNTLAHDVTCIGQRIASVRTRQLRSEREHLIEAQVFIDASGDGLVGAKAGATYMQGREGRAQFNESLAPEEPDDFTLGDTLLFSSRRTGSPVAFRRPALAPPFESWPFFKNINKPGMHRDARMKKSGLHGQWWLEFGGQLDTIGDDQKITEELRRIVYSFWDYVKNSGYYQDTADLALDWVAPIPGKRESRRFVGRHVICQSDIMDKPDWPDPVACAGWPMDIHAPKGIFDDEPATAWNHVPGSFNIPLRALYSVNIGNLFFAGRNMSATHVAFGSTRVAATGGAMGQAAGTAAALCVKHGKTPDEIDREHFPELLEMLQREDQTILFHKEKCLAFPPEEVSVTSSSTALFQHVVAGSAVASAPGKMLALPSSPAGIDSLQIKLLNTGEETTLHVSIQGGRRIEAYLPERELKTLDLPVPGHFDGWLTIPAGCQALADEKLYFFFTQNPQISFQTAEDAPTGAVFFNWNEDPALLFGKELATLDRRDDCVLFKNISPPYAPFSAENVFNGFSRPFGQPNCWTSASLAEQEAELTIHLTPKAEFSTLDIIFNTNLEKDWPIGPAPRLVRNYRIIFTDRQGHTTTKMVKDNIHRVNRHPITQKLSTITIICEATRGAARAEIFALKLL
jgi:hypothetical protein